MSTGKIIFLGLKIIALTIVLVVAFIVASTVSGITAMPGDSEQAGEEVPAIFLPLLLVSFLKALVFTYIILRCRWYGWKLMGAIFLAFYGLMTVVTQIESAVYLPDKLPQDMIAKLFVMGAVMAGLFSPLAVLVLGRMTPGLEPQGRNLRLVMPPRQWLWKLAVITVAYLILYFGFGYFVAWKQPVVRQYYGGTDPGSFFAQMVTIGQTTPWMFALQVFRALLWTAFVLPIIRMLKGPQWEVGLAVALLFAVWSSMLLLPNPYMPQVVTRIHLVETVPSNFIFGFLVGCLLSRDHRSVRDLLQMTESV